MNSNPDVMEYFSATLTTAESDALIDREMAHLDEHGWGLWAVEISATELRARGWVLSQGLLALPYYLDSHDGMVRVARRAIRAALDTPLPDDL